MDRLILTPLYYRHMVNNGKLTTFIQPSQAFAPSTGDRVICCSKGRKEKVVSLTMRYATIVHCQKVDPSRDEDRWIKITLKDEGEVLDV